MTVSETFEQFLSGLELDKSYQEIVEDRHAAVRDYLESRLPGVRTQLIGSLQRRTRIDPLTGLQDFDIDILVELFSFERWALPGQGFTGEDALARVEGAVKDGVRYRKMGAHEDRPAIVIPYGDGSSIELVPALRDRVPGSPGYGRTYWVPRGGAWRPADYDYDANWISQANTAADGRLVPTIKMLKAWRRAHCAEMRSYHLEVLAAHAVLPLVLAARQRGQLLPWPVLIAGTLATMIASSGEPALIVGSTSEPADNHVTPVLRGVITAAIRAATQLAFLANNLVSQSESQSLQVWRGIFGPPFPA